MDLKDYYRRKRAEADALALALQIKAKEFLAQGYSCVDAEEKAAAYLQDQLKQS